MLCEVYDIRVLDSHTRDAMKTQNNLEKTDPSEKERTYNIRKQQSRFIESVNEN